MSENIFEALRDDHETQRTLLDILVKTRGDSEGREELFEKLKMELDAHAVAEEKAFYSYLMGRDLTQPKARHSVAEHQEIDDCVEELENMDFSSPAWLPKMKRLRELVVHHLDEEEHEVFQMAGKALNESEKQELAGEYRDEKEEAEENL